MAKVMPGGPPDQTGFFLARLAASDDALTRLYLTLIEKREERRRNEAFQREMLGLRQGHDRSMQDARFDYADRNNPAPQEQANPFAGGGAQGNPIPQTTTTPPPATTTTPPAAAPAARPRPGDPPATFLPGTNQAPPSDRFSSNNSAGENALAAVMASYNDDSEGPEGDRIPAAAAFAQGPAPTTATGVDPRTGQPRGTIAGQAARNRQPPGTVARPPRRPTRQEVGFREIHPEWVQRMRAAEEKYQLPSGILLTLYGYENGGGAHLGKNPRSSASGLFQFTDAVRQQWGIRNEDALNPNVMIDAAAKNLRHNANSYKKLTGGRDMPTDPQFIPHWVALHQWGVVDGTRIVNAALSGADHMPAAQVMLRTNNRNNAAVLVNNGLSSNATVGDIFNQTARRVQPWYDRSLPILYPNGEVPQRPPANVPQSSVTPAPATQQPSAPRPQQQTAASPTTLTPEPALAPQQPQEVASAIPRPPETVPPGQRTERVGPFTAIRTGGIPPDASERGVNPRLIAAVRGGAALALPPGYKIRLTSGFRRSVPGKPQGYHHHGQASDWQIYRPDGTPIRNQGEDTTGLYTRLARGVKTWVAENDPSAMRHIGYGGAFGTKIGGGGVPDLMHFDWGGSRGRMRPNVQFARLTPLARHERNAPAEQQQQAVRQGPVTTPQGGPIPLPPKRPGEAGPRDPIQQYGGSQPQPATATDTSPPPVQQRPLNPVESQIPFPLPGQRVPPPLPNFFDPNKVPGGRHGALGTQGGVQFGFTPTPVPTQRITPEQQPQQPLPSTATPFGGNVPLPQPRPAEAGRGKGDRLMEIPEGMLAEEGSPFNDIDAAATQPPAPPLPRPRPPEAGPREDDPTPPPAIAENPNEFDIPLPRSRPFTPDNNPDVAFSHGWPQPVDPRDDFSEPPDVNNPPIDTSQGPNWQEQAERFNLPPAAPPTPTPDETIPLPPMSSVPNMRPSWEVNTDVAGASTAEEQAQTDQPTTPSPGGWQARREAVNAQRNIHRPSAQERAVDMVRRAQELGIMPQQAEPVTPEQPQVTAPPPAERRPSHLRREDRPAGGAIRAPAWLNEALDRVPQTNEDRQRAFDSAAAQWLRDEVAKIPNDSRVRFFTDWWNGYNTGPRRVPTTRIGGDPNNPPQTPATRPQVQPTTPPRTQPANRQPIDTGVPLPDQEPLVITPRPGAARPPAAPPFTGPAVGQPAAPPIDTSRPRVMGAPNATTNAPAAGIPPGSRVVRSVDANGNPVFIEIPSGQAPAVPVAPPAVVQEQELVE